MLPLAMLLVSAAVAAAYDLHYVIRSEQIDVGQLPPGFTGAHWVSQNGRFQATTVVDPSQDKYGGPTLNVKLYLMGFCFTGEFLDPSSPTATAKGLLNNTETNLTMTKPDSSASYWCATNDFVPDLYYIQVHNLQWISDINITFPVPAPETALSDDVVATRVPLVSSNGTLNSDIVSIPDGSKTDILLSVGSSYCIRPNTSLTITIPPGTAFLMLYGATLPTTTIHWFSQSNYTFSHDLPLHHDNQTGGQPQLLFTKNGNSPLDTNHAMFLNTPLDPAVNNTVTFSYTASIYPTSHNLTEAVFYMIRQDPGRNLTRTSSTSPTGKGAADKSTSSHSSTGAIAGGVVGGIVGLLAIISVIVFFVLRNKRRRREQEKAKHRVDLTGEMFSTDENLPAMTTPLPSSTATWATGSSLPPGAAPAEIQPYPGKPATFETYTKPTRTPSAALPPRPPRPRGPRFLNDADAGRIEAVRDDADEEDEVVLMPPTYDPSWRDPPTR